MGLLTSEIIQILKCKQAYKEKKPSLCMLGKQDILIKWPQFVREINLFGFDYDEQLLKELEEKYPIDAFAFFKMLGFGKVNALDYSDYEGADVMFDLNSHEMPYDLKGAYDFVINGGTLEHVFDAAQALHNINELAKVGGIIYHISPLAGGVDHGFFSFSPTFYLDYYKANNYIVKLIDMEFLDSSRGGVIYSQDCRLFENAIEINKYIRKISNEEYPDVLLECIVEKTGPITEKSPVQGYYDKVYSHKTVAMNYAKVACYVKDCGIKNIAFWGSGRDGIRTLKEVINLGAEEQIYCFFDSDITKAGNAIAGVHIEYPSRNNLAKTDLIIITSTKYEDKIYKQLCELGIDERKIIRGSSI